ncbi:hypothetical protein EB796_012094 [Bugula neritina]|uniref:Uncharacterized protein n=1 Tax=Bugula neritina TaxID=10212 RepID=A0A7J7JTA7_BUGNE|nr:hypothetical protein EB796_012094 [Bugula neritina]
MPNKQSIIENFQLTGTKYSLLRGVAADLGVDGMFRVDKTGIYQFTVTLNFHSRHKVTADKKPNLVQVAICPNGECSKGVDSSEDIAVPQYSIRWIRDRDISLYS